MFKVGDKVRHTDNYEILTILEVYEDTESYILSKENGTVVLLYCNQVTKRGIYEHE